MFAIFKQFTLPVAEAIFLTLLMQMFEMHLELTNH